MLQVVTYLITVRTVNEDVKVKVLVPEGVCPAEGVFWQGRTDICTVVLVNDTITAVNTCRVVFSGVDRFEDGTVAYVDNLIGPCLPRQTTGRSQSAERCCFRLPRR